MNTTRRKLSLTVEPLEGRALLSTVVPVITSTDVLAHAGAVLAQNDAALNSLLSTLSAKTVSTKPTTVSTVAAVAAKNLAISNVVSSVSQVVATAKLSDVKVASHLMR